MQRASEMPLEVDAAASDTLAASGGLDLPGRTGDGLTARRQADRREAARMAPPTAASIDKLWRQPPAEAGGEPTRTEGA